jgi:hypothetical protein
LRRVGQDRIREELMLGGFAFDRMADPAAAAADCDAVLARWVAAGLPTGRAPDGGPGFNPAEVQNFMVWSARYLADDFWLRTFVPTARRLVRDLAAQPAATIAEVTFRRRFPARPRPAGRRLRLPMPLGLAAAALRSLGAWPAPARHWPGRLECQLPQPCATALELGWQASIPLSVPLDPTTCDAGERELWTRPREGLIHVSATVAALAQTLASGETKPFRQAMRLWRWVNDNLLMGAIAYDEIDPAAPMDWLLRRRWMDCQLGAALLASLARALGLPARLHAGHFAYAIAPCQHYWAELWLEPLGWQPFDLFSWNLSAGGRDPEWRDHFAGRLEPRLTSQLMPRLVTGPVGEAMPQRWYAATVAAEGGIRTSIEDAATGAVAFEDLVSVAYPSVNASPL